MERQFELARKFGTGGLTALSIVLGLVFTGGALAREGGTSSNVASTVVRVRPDSVSSGVDMISPAVAEQKPMFPLAIRPGERYLVDSAGKPFLIQGDTAWSLIGDLTREEVEHYLEDRRLRGFNTLLVNLIENRFSKQAPANAYGERPFLIDGDFATPNEAYFAHAEWILRRAAEKGLVVLLAPAYLGNGGGSEGWYKEMKHSGAAKLKEYGRYLGRRFGSMPNIIWVHGGDYNPPDKSLVRAIVDGIREFDPDALHTAHAAPGNAALDYWAGEAWLRISNVYTYESVREAASGQYARPEGLPFFLIESAYENEHGATEHRLRVQAYQALLSGAAGQIFGNNPIWHFGGPGLYPAPTDWQGALGSRGAQSMTHLRELFAALPWWKLQPGSRLLVDGAGRGDEHVAAARAADGSFAIVYLPTIRHVTIDVSKLTGPHITARWFDPSSGRFSDASGSRLSTEGLEGFRPTGRNDANLGDWVLVLTSHP